jgi:hypothetical protein
MAWAYIDDHRGASVRPRRRASLAAVLSVLAHGALLLAFILSLRPATGPMEQRAIDAELTPSPPPPTIARVAKSPARSNTVAATIPTALHELPPPPTPAILPTTPAPGAPNPTAASGLTRSLRGTLGCDHADFLRLGAVERERCAGRLAAGAADTPVLSGIDPVKRATFAAEAADQGDVLSRMPKTGCRPRVAISQEDAPTAQRQGVTAGVSCVIRF